MKIPWETMCNEYFGEPFTEGAITQHLAKLRLRRIEAGLRVPPPLRRSPKEAEKQAAALKRKVASSNDSESFEGSESGGLFVSDNDEEYMPGPKRAKKKSPKSKNNKTQETPRPTRTARLNIRPQPLDEPESQQGVEFPSSDPSPFDLRYRDACSTTLQPTGGRGAHDRPTGGPQAIVAQSQVVTSNAPPAFPDQFVPWTAGASFPAVRAIPGDQTSAMSPRGNNFTAASQANTYAPAFQVYSMAPPTPAISIGQRITSPESDTSLGQPFGPDYGSQQQYWYARVQHWMPSPVQPARDQRSEVIDPRPLRSDIQAEFEREGDATKSGADQELTFADFIDA